MTKIKKSKIKESESLLKRVRRIDQTIQTHGIQEQSLNLLKEDLRVVSEYLGTSELKSVFFSIVLVTSINEQAPHVHDISSKVGLEVIDFMPYLSMLDELVRQGIFRKRKARNRMAEEALRNRVFVVDEKIMNAVIREQPMPKLEADTPEGSIEVFQQINDWMGQASDNEITEFDFVHDCHQLMEQSQHFPLIKEIWDMEMIIEYKIIFIYTIWRTISGYNTIELEHPCDTVSISSSARIRMLQRFAHGEDPLSIQGLVTVKEGRFGSDLEICLTEKAMSLLAIEKIQVKDRKGKRADTLKPADILSKALFYNEEEEQQFERIYSLLQEDNFQRVNERMKNKGMRTGFNILFHGAPGTGKTESVLQLAKLTNREIMKIDISMTKSMWFGESEKLMKRVFTNYEELRKNSDITPILFFNEADAILGNRKTDTSSNVAQTENALQNILLEAMEDFNGIFIATTNLIENLDAAFDRRFIYKMCFFPPEISVAAKIWEQNIPTLSKQECEHLAARFFFSGGQIDNVVRKCEIEYLLTGNEIGISTIIGFCEKEILLKSGNSNPIGF